MFKDQCERGLSGVRGGPVIDATMHWLEAFCRTGMGVGRASRDVMGG